MLWAFEIQGAQFMIYGKNWNFRTSRPGAKLRSQGPPGAVKEQPWY